MIEELAKAMHQNYVRAQRSKGESAATNPSLQNWDQLDEGLRQSSRRFAESLGGKLAELGYGLVQSPSGGASAALSLTREQVESLSEAEHNRWVTDLLRDGWSLGDAKDVDRKIHPLLVPWGELSEEEREKDRDAVRGLPEIIATARLSVQLIR